MARVLELQRERWAQGERPRVEEFLRADPTLDREVVLDLVYQEILLREREKESPSLGEYRARFPELAEDLQLQFEAHSALEELDLPAGDDREDVPELPGYEIVGRLGAGGMSVVYEARQISLGRHVALKLLPRVLASDAEALHRFRREAQLASALNHPHISTIYDLGQHEERPFIVMELVRGQTLRVHLRQRVELATALSWIGQAAMAFEAAHIAGVIHRDIKPENLMVRDDGVLKVLDFGLARLVSRTAEALGDYTTLTGTLFGTLQYMSPEQLRGDPVEAPGDVFALGVVLYELCTGRHPFMSKKMVETMSAIQSASATDPAALNPEVSAPLQELMQQMLATEAADRPTMEAVRLRLAELSRDA